MRRIGPIAASCRSGPLDTHHFDSIIWRSIRNGPVLARGSVRRRRPKKRILKEGVSVKVWAKFRALKRWQQWAIGGSLALVLMVAIVPSTEEDEGRAEDSSASVVAASTSTEAATATESPTLSVPSPTPATSADSSLTTSQRNAIRAAQSYLDFSGFSRQGLIDQLSSEYGDQYPVEDATLAVDSLSVDWNEQAVRSGEAYLNFSAFSCQGLIDQLSSEYGDQYTVSQATYAATQIGLC